MIGEDASLGEALHPVLNFDIDPIFFVDQVTEIVFYDDLFGDDVELQEICLPLKAESIGHGRHGHLEGARNYSVELSIDYK